MSEEQVKQFDEAVATAVKSAYMSPEHTSWAATLCAAQRDLRQFALLHKFLGNPQALAKYAEEAVDALKMVVLFAKTAPPPTEQPGGTEV